MMEVEGVESVANIESMESIENIENEPVLAIKERDYGLENAVSISRQWGVLLDDYRYLLQKFSSDCSCHLTFDNMFFLKGMEQRYEALRKMANENEYLSAFSNDDNDWSTINNLWQNSTKSNSAKGLVTSAHRMIRRITVVNDMDSNPTLLNVSNLSPTKASNPSRRSKRQLEKVSEESTEVPSTNTKENQPTEATTTIETTATTTETTATEATEAATTTDSTTTPTTTLSLASKVFKCGMKECDFTSMSKQKYDSHIRYHQGTVSGTVPVASNSVYHICHECGKEFPTEEGMKNHIQNSHVDVKIFTCEISGCTYKTKFRSCFKDHMTRHSGKKSFRCDGYPDCEKDFRTKRDLMAHINFHHKSIRRFTCTFAECGLSFKDSNRLKHHMYIHTGERPYKCKFRGCDSSFKQVPHLKKHMKIHMNKQHEMMDDDEDYSEHYVIDGLEDQAYLCPAEDCNQAFVGSNEFQDHIRQMHPNMDELYGCSEENCESVFASLDETVKHMQEVHGQTVETVETQ